MQGEFGQRPSLTECGQRQSTLLLSVSVPSPCPGRANWRIFVQGISALAKEFQAWEKAPSTTERLRFPKVRRPDRDLASESDRVKSHASAPRLRDRGLGHCAISLLRLSLFLTGSCFRAAARSVRQSAFPQLPGDSRIHA